jgi:hypothetical protein
MKAIYINLDPYLAAFAAWLKGGKVGDAPKFDPLPLAVTIPLGESAGIVVPGGTLDGDVNAISVFSVDGVTISVSLDPTETAMPDPPAGESVVTNDFGPGYTAYATEMTVNSVFSVSGDSAAQTVYLFDGDDNPLGAIPFTVLVRRETASGPVDLVDFTPPASGAPSAADIKSALVEAGVDALEGVSIAGTVLPENAGINCGLTGGGLTTAYFYDISEGGTITSVIGQVTTSD